MGTLTGVAFAAAVNIRFRSFHRENIKTTTLPKLRDRLCFSCTEDSHRFRDFPRIVVKCLGNDENGNRDASVGENGETHKSSVVKTASRDEEDDETSISSSTSSSSNEFGSDKTSLVQAHLSLIQVPFCLDFQIPIVRIECLLFLKFSSFLVIFRVSSANWL